MAWAELNRSAQIFAKGAESGVKRGKGLAEQYLDIKIAETAGTNNKPAQVVFIGARRIVTGLKKM